MSNSFFISTAPELAAIQAVVDSNETEIALIRGTDLPGVITEIDANETKIDSIIALIPQKIRGHLTRTYLSHTHDTYHDVINLTDSQGKLFSVIIKAESAITSAYIRITIDGVISNELLIDVIDTDHAIYHNLGVGLAGFFHLTHSITELFPWNIEFDTSCKVETRIIAGAGNLICEVLYNLDDL